MTFDVWPTPIAAEDIQDLRGDVDRAAEEKRRELTNHGCAAADYRLSGAEVEHICVVVLPRKHRMLTGFPSEDEVSILLVGLHDETNPEVNVYTRLYEGLGIDVPSGERRKPPCCADGRPPVNADLVDDFLTGSKRLRRGRAARRSRSRRSRRRLEG